jgi:hypothetical protein
MIESELHFHGCPRGGRDRGVFLKKNRLTEHISVGCGLPWAFLVE